MILKPCYLIGVCAVLSVISTSNEDLVTGIDLTWKLGRINWKKAHEDGIYFGVVKCSDGNHFIDPMCNWNIEQMKKNNIKVGVFHYFRGKIGAKAQAEHIITALKESEFDYDKNVLAIDIEARKNEDVPPEQMADTINDLLEELQQKFKNIYIYTQPDYWQNYVLWQKYSYFFQSFKLWISDHTEGAQQPKIPSTWQFQRKNRQAGYTWWQYQYGIGDVKISSEVMDADGNKVVKTVNIWYSRANKKVFEGLS